MRHAQPYWDIEAQYPLVGDNPEPTGFYADLLRGFFKPRVAPTLPTPDAREKASNKPEDKSVVRGTSEAGEPKLKRVEETYDADLQEWVDVEEDLGKDWVSVVAKKP